MFAIRESLGDIDHTRKLVLVRDLYPYDTAEDFLAYFDLTFMCAVQNKMPPPKREPYKLSRFLAY